MASMKNQHRLPLPQANSAPVAADFQGRILAFSKGFQVESIHGRMPVKPPWETAANWLDPVKQDTGLLKEILLPYDPGLVKVYQVSTLVNAAFQSGR